MREELCVNYNDFYNERDKQITFREHSGEFIVSC